MITTAVRVECMARPVYFWTPKAIRPACRDLCPQFLSKSLAIVLTGSHPFGLVHLALIQRKRPQLGHIHLEHKFHSVKYMPGCLSAVGLRPKGSSRFTLEISFLSQKQKGLEVLRHVSMVRWTSEDEPVISLKVLFALDVGNLPELGLIAAKTNPFGNVLRHLFRHPAPAVIGNQDLLHSSPPCLGIVLPLNYFIFRMRTSTSLVFFSNSAILAGSVSP